MCRKKSRTKRLGVLLAMLGLAGAPLALPAETAEQPLTQMLMTPSQITWLSQLPENALVLTVSAKDVYLRQEFESGAPPSLVVIGPDGELLPDGAYTWEIHAVGRTDRSALPEGNAKVAATSERSGVRFERRRARRMRLQSGDFQIEGGTFVVPDITTALEQR